VFVGPISFLIMAVTKRHTLSTRLRSRVIDRFIVSRFRAVQMPARDQ